MAAGSANKSRVLGRGGPFFATPPMWNNAANPEQALTDEERTAWAVAATIGRFKKGETIFREGDAAAAIFSIVGGVIKLYRKQPDHKEHILRFMFANDLIGLAEYGKYVNSAKSVTDTILFKIPTQGLELRLRRNPVLEFHIISRLCHDIRRTQDHALLLAKRRADVKIALFIAMLEKQQNSTGSDRTEIYLPMTRAEIAAYVGTSLEAVSRSFGDLVGCGAIAFRDRRHFTIADRTKLESVIAGTDHPDRIDDRTAAALVSRPRSERSNA
jgi:CRP/FNR family transcriptional regulator, anaerobic regulatory protein